MKILAIESSCDETAVAVIEDSNVMLSNIVASSMTLHAAFGGVIPEIAARSHIESIIPVIEESLGQAMVDWDDIDGIAVTNGAGLSGSLLIGVMTARTLSIIKDKPLYSVNHVEGHVYANFITKTALPGYILRESQPAFPVLAIIVSGGHTQLAIFENHGEHHIIGKTLDDAIGEAFDKVAKILGLPYPGGPSVSRIAEQGNANKYSLPKANMSNSYDFSFSGLKTAVLRLAQKEIGKDFSFPSQNIAEKLSESQKADIAAGFQRVSIETVVDKAFRAFKQFNPKSVVVGGGVAANFELRRQLSEKIPIDVQYADTKLCTDNGAMIGALGCFEYDLQLNQADPYGLRINPSLVM